jgi:hypothetical protein
LPLAIRPNLFPADRTVVPVTSLQSLAFGPSGANGSQPASRYWSMQWIETAIYLALSLALAGYCFWRLERRVP